MPAAPAPQSPQYSEQGKSRVRRLGVRARRALFLYVGNNDDRFARSVKWSASLHLFVVLLALLPLLGRSFGCGKLVYERPAGGETKPKMVQRVRVRRTQRVIHNPHAPVAFDFPDVKELNLSLDRLTERAYAGRIGAGAGTGEGAGYGGLGPGGKVRFIRLKYDSGDWDQDYGLGADVNMLQEFGRRTGIKVADMTEHVTIRDLLRFSPKQSPPFIYITGERRIYVTDREAKMLRDYLLNRGGMLFADNGGGEFDREFRKLIKRVLQEYDLFIIPYDDEIFQRPSLLNGAPPLWHHSGRDALGIRHNGRLVVFYHQGDLGDAWKDDHGGTPAASWQAAYNLGVNVIDYAFRHYQEWLSRQK